VKRARIPDEAVDLFAAMRECECTCEPRDWSGEYWKHEQCAGCEAWWQMHGKLFALLQLHPWQWPAYEHPDAACPYPPGSHAAEHWRPNADARERYHQLSAALAEREAKV
jgi:hypothetical protein